MGGLLALAGPLEWLYPHCRRMGVVPGGRSPGSSSPSVGSSSGGSGGCTVGRVPCCARSLACRAWRMLMRAIMSNATALAGTAAPMATTLVVLHAARVDVAPPSGAGCLELLNGANTAPPPGPTLSSRHSAASHRESAVGKRGGGEYGVGMARTGR